MKTHPRKKDARKTRSKTQTKKRRGNPTFFFHQETNPPRKKVKIEIELFKQTTLTMNSMEIVKQLYTEQIKESWRGKYGDDFEGQVFEEFRDEWIEGFYNTETTEEHQWIHEPFNEIYTHLVFFLGMVKENQEEFDYFFKDWDNPQKVYELGLYYLAKDVITSMSQESLEEESLEEERPVIHRAGGVNWENYHRMVEAGIITPNGEEVEEESSEEEEEEEKEELEPSQ